MIAPPPLSQCHRFWTAYDQPLTQHKRIWMFFFSDMTLFTQVVGLWIVVNQSFVIRWDPWWTWSSECWFVSTSKSPLWICWWFQFSSVLWRDWRLCHLSKSLCNSTISGVFAVYPTFRSTSTWDYEWHVPSTAYSHDHTVFATKTAPRRSEQLGERWSHGAQWGVLPLARQARWGEAFRPRKIRSNNWLVSNMVNDG